MSYLSEFCCICLENDQNIKNMLNEDDDGIILQTKLLVFLPEYVRLTYKISHNMCANCIEKLNNIYLFKQKCLQSISLLNEYVQKLDSNNQFPVTLTDILHYKNTMTIYANVEPEYKDVKFEFMDAEDANQKDEIQDDIIDETKVECVLIKSEMDSESENYIDENVTEETGKKNTVFSEDIANVAKQEPADNSSNPIAKIVSLNLLPEKSRTKYEKQYELFITWCKNKKIGNYSENVMVAYFSEKAKIVKFSTLLSTYSMLRSVLQVKNNIDISKYKKLTAFLKNQSVGYKPEKSRIFTKEQVMKFLREAPDKTYLLKKVILIMGVFGAWSRDELVQMKTQDIEDKDSILIVRVPDPKTRKNRVFILSNNDEESVDFLSLYRKYVALRPRDDNTPNRLFLRYSEGRCFKQVVGMNLIGRTPSEIAQYLNLPDSKSYNGHSFRRTSTKFLAN